MQLARAMLSVAEQTLRPVEHVIVSDGPDPVFSGGQTATYASQLAAHYPGYCPVFAELEDHDPGEWWGRRAKLQAVVMASAPLLNCLDDDDVLRPGHLAALHQLLRQDPQAGFAFSRLWIGPPILAHDPDAEAEAVGTKPWPDRGSIHTGAQLMFRRELLDVAAWENIAAPEWQMVGRWVEAGAAWQFCPRVTCVMYQHDDYTYDGYPPGRCQRDEAGAVDGGA